MMYPVTTDTWLFQGEGAAPSPPEGKLLLVKGFSFQKACPHIQEAFMKRYPQ